MMPKKAKRRSGRVAATLLAAAAAVAVTTMSGCSNSDTTARCVDQNGNVLPDSACQGGTSVGNGYAGGSGGYYGGGSGGASSRWVYGGEGGNAVGSKATGYSTTAPSEGDISSPSGTVIRGGFGGEGEGHGGGEGGGEGGGHGGGGGE